MDRSIDTGRPVARGLACAVALFAATLGGGAHAQPAPPSQPRAPASAPTPPPPPAALPPAPPGPVPQAQPPALPSATPQPGYPVQPAPGFAPPFPAYGAPPPGYGAPPPGYGAPPPGYGAPPPGYPPGYAPYGGYPPPYYYGAPYAYPQAWSPPVEPPRRRSSVPMMTGGIVLTSVGAILVIGGSALAASAKDRTIIFCESSIGLSQCGRKDSAPRIAGGVALLIGGGLGIAVGIPLWFLGGKRAPLQKDDAPPAPPSARPTVSLGLGSAKLDWRF